MSHGKKDDQAEKKPYKAVIHDESITLTEEQYRVLLCDVKAVPLLAEEENAYNRENPEEEDFMNPSAWKLSDSIEDAIRQGADILGQKAASACRTKSTRASRR